MTSVMCCTQNHSFLVSRRQIPPVLMIRIHCLLWMATGMYPSGIAGTFSSPLWRIHAVLPIPVPVGHRSGTAYPINKDTWGRSFAIGDVSSSPGYKCRSLGDTEEKERGCEEDEQSWQRDRTEKARGTNAREAGMLVLLTEMVRKN